jgi:lipopolysaccharide/colanic/teichoic acid biosynthesis glycosyltransferase
MSVIPLTLEGRSAELGQDEVVAPRRPKMARSRRTASVKPRRWELRRPLIAAVAEVRHSSLEIPLRVRPLPRWKRAMDIMGAVMGLLLLLPLFMIAAAAVRLSSAGPIIFKQKRAGLGGRPFTIYKFRTMSASASEEGNAALRRYNEQDGPVFKMRNDPRLTPVGKFLRRTSIDELPQLWNVLRGDMSLVGPRPLEWTEAQACDSWERRRLEVTPGITCIWQVSGRSDLPFLQWIRMDLDYIQRRSVFLDTYILLRTVPAVLCRRGAI